jgi:hypothetical protein
MTQSRQEEWILANGASGIIAVQVSAQIVEELVKGKIIE